MPSNASTTSEVKAFARQLGFDLVGITTADAPKHSAQFQRWLADGFHGEMAYMSRNAGKRVSPQQVLAGARSIIVVAMNYYPGESGFIARYAAGTRDYHELIGEKLTQLAELVGGIWYVDTGPFLERDLAQRAGVGFIGKHTNLISRRLGNWFFLAEILTTLELEPDAARARAGGGEKKSLWPLFPLPGSLPHPSYPRALRPRRPPLYLLPDHRTQREHSRGPAASHRHSHLWLRRLSGGLSVEPVCEGRQSDAETRSPRPGSAGSGNPAVSR